MNTKKMIIFDMDDTLISNNTWMDFNMFMGMTAEEDYSLYKQFAKGEINYNTWTTKLVEEYQKHPNKSQQEIETVLGNFNLSPGAKSTVETAKKLGLETVLLTGSFLITAEAVAKSLGIEHVLANTVCTFNKDGFFTDLQSGGNEEEAKVAMMNSLCKKNIN